VTLGWGVLALAVAALGWRRRHSGLRAWAVVLLGLAIGRLFTLDLADDLLRRVIWVVGEQGVSVWLGLAVGMGVVGHAVGWLVGGGKSIEDPAAEAASPLGIVLATAGTVVYFVAGVVALHGIGLTYFGLAGVAVLVALSRVGDELGYAAQAGVAGLAVGLKWIAFDGLAQVMANWGVAGDVAPVANSVALAGAILIALAVGLGRRLRGEAREVGPVAVAVLCFAWLNFEALRAVDFMTAQVADLATAKQVALSVLWGAVGLAGVVVGFARGARPLRYAALGLLGVTLVKILLVDLAQVRPVYRILSFLAVGGLLLCVSFVYHRQERVEEI
jgi:uncharacterized membrane protein